jgi:hypothetical protein
MSWVGPGPGRSGVGILKWTRDFSPKYSEWLWDALSQLNGYWSKKWVEPYLYSFYMPLWCGQGQLVGSILTMNGLETCVGNSDCRYVTRFEVLVFDAEKYV